MLSRLTHVGPLHPPISPVTHCSFSGLAGPGTPMVSRPHHYQSAVHVCGYDSNTAPTRPDCKHGPCPLPSHIPHWASKGKCPTGTLAVGCTQETEDQASACQRVSRLITKYQNWQNPANMLTRRCPGVLHNSLAASTCWLCDCHRSENSCTQQSFQHPVFPFHRI